MTYTIAPSIRQQFFDSNGDPLVGGKLYVYLNSNGTTLAATYTDSTGTENNTNPIILDDTGRTPHGIWLTDGVAVDFKLTDADDTIIFRENGILTQAVSNTSFNEWILYGNTATYTGATTFTIVGDQTATFIPSRRVKALVTAGAIYGTISTSAFTTVTTVTVTWDSGSLDSGLSAVYYALISIAAGLDNTSVPITVGGYLFATEEYANTTAGQNSSAGMNTRHLNTEKVNTIAGASLASYQYTLAAGTYRVRAFCMGWKVNLTRAHIYDVSNAVVLVSGLSCNAASGPTENIACVVTGQFTIAASTIIELRHYTQSAVTSGLGKPANSTDTQNEVYAQIELWKV